MTDNPLFQTHLLNEQGIKKAVKIQQIFEAAHGALKEVVGFESREWSIAQTKLEEAAFFAKKAMAKDAINHQALRAAVLSNEC